MQRFPANQDCVYFITYAVMSPHASGLFAGYVAWSDNTAFKFFVLYTNGGRSAIQFFYDLSFTNEGLRHTHFLRSVNPSQTISFFVDYFRDPEGTETNQIYFVALKFLSLH
jgi:hypothetical protein